ncbi:hypothetical protein [Cellulomonas sp. KRMCY2]|uniref:variant leucine-rich repeat-containing protein n=1 Tax=Cellulomonas sp. KRMCY2 TaxID=1304865 RepID=UPI00045E9969|nr:hypothetical protein [Cellulomonas sp. KRMCY2]
MSEPQNYTAQQAADPTTPAEVLADIAALRPDLRAAVAGNPSAYPGLLEWLGTLGDPTVDVMLASRSGRAGTDAQQTAVLPTTPAAPPWQGGQPSGTPAFGTAPPYAGSQTPGYGAAPAPTPGYGAAPGYAGAQAPGYGAAPGGPQGPGQYGFAPAGAPAPGSGSKKALWIVLGIVGVLALLGIAGFFVIRGLIGAAIPSGEYGSDDALDSLYDRCADEDWAACDQLYMESPTDSEYETFGDTCGNRTDGGTYCVEEFAVDAPADEPSAYGDDPALDALWDACAGGDGQACDDLYNQSPFGSEYETFGDTCGGTTDGGSFCAEDAGVTVPDVNTFGDDAELDALWTACAGGDGQACDDLYWNSPGGSEYESFGDTCGGTTDGIASCVPTTVTGANTYGDDPALDALWDACAAGDGQACDDLYSQAPVGSEYESFGDTCAGTKDGTEWCAP